MSLDKKKVILYGSILFFAFYFFNKLSCGWRIAPGGSIAGKFLNLGAGVSASFGAVLISFNGVDILAGLAGASAEDFRWKSKP